MKTKFLAPVLGFLTLSLSIFNASADPLNNWHWRNPLPNGNPSVGSNALFGLCFTNGEFVGVGAWGTVATSTDGRFWAENPSSTTNQLNSIIYGNGLFVAVGNNGAVESSPDGTNWTLSTPVTAKELTSVAFGNGTYCAGGPSQIIITSTDGIHWTQVFNGLGATQIAGSSYGFVAVNGNGTNQAYFSSTGRSWSTNALPVSVGGFDGSLLKAQTVTFTKGLFLIGSVLPGAFLSQGVNFIILASPDGINWPTNVVTSHGQFLVNQYNFFITGGSNIIASSIQSGGNCLQFSPDGITWSVTNDVPEEGNAGALGNGTYVMAGGPGTGSTTHYGVYFSTDGLNWAYQPYSSSLPVGPQSTFTSIAYTNGTYVVATSSSFVVSTNDALYMFASNTPSLSSVITFGTNFVGVGAKGQIYLSTNGLSWTQKTSNTTNNLHCAAVGNNLLVAVGDNGVVQTSPNGTSWTSRTSGTALSLSGVVYSNRLFVAVGEQGTVITSPDGVSWISRNSGVVSNLLAVTYGPAGFLAVGANGIILTSLDGVNWTSQNSGSSATLETAAAGNGYYVVAGANATVLTSFDGANWAPLSVGATGGQPFYGSGFLNGRFDIVGAYGNILESDPIPPLFDLQMHATPFQNVFSIFATPGSSYRILSSATVNATSWSTAATINNAAAITLWTNSAAAGNQNYFRLVSP